MYEELIEKLRHIENAPWYAVYDFCSAAADAIERLQRENAVIKSALPYVQKWIPIESRPMTEEERAEYSEFLGYDIQYDEAIIYTSDLPDDGDEILVCNKWGRVFEDKFIRDDDYGCGLEENGDLDGIVAWMPKPAPYKPEPPKEET